MEGRGCRDPSGAASVPRRRPGPAAGGGRWLKRRGAIPCPSARPLLLRPPAVAPFGLRSGSAGFTLMELIVVVLVLGILTVLSVPGFMKTIEVSKARDAASTLNMIASAHRAYALDNGDAYLTGADATSALGAAHKLVARKYVPPEDWSGKSYEFFVCPRSTSGGGACCGASVSPTAPNPVACARRKTSGAQAAPTGSDYASWQFVAGESGKLGRAGAGAPDPN